MSHCTSYILFEDASRKNVRTIKAILRNTGAPTSHVRYGTKYGHHAMDGEDYKLPQLNNIEIHFLQHPVLYLEERNKRCC
ncbi:hypothetical protein RJT34_10427 [Clitoria ternatea]|uniref:Uncharacterized protein n=1 Tax=Clitoria ternatea TaxID=43366 RepID=A0AAN9PVN1_CLITE